ncbi:MAG: hypothetical protein N2C14_11640, partial [Planctomycetales bacterium]
DSLGFLCGFLMNKPSSPKSRPPPPTTRLASSSPIGLKNAELLRLLNELLRIEVFDRAAKEAAMLRLLYEKNVQPIMPTFTYSIGMRFVSVGDRGDCKPYLHRRGRGKREPCFATVLSRRQQHLLIG